MALPATDSFTDSDGVQLTTHNASWTLCKGDFDIQSNSLAGDAAGELGAGWNADAFNADQYSEATVVAISSAVIGIAVRCDDDTPDDYYYGYYGTSTGSWLFKVVNGAWTQLDTGSGFSVSDTIRLEISGTNPGTLTGYINAGGDVSGSDSDIDAGSAGVSGYDDFTVSRIDDWEGGNLGAAGGTPLYVNLSGLPRATIG